MYRFTIFAVILIAFLTSCTKTIDGTSEETLKSSIDEIKTSLSNEKKKEFEQAIMVISFSGLDFKELIKSGDADTQVKAIKDKLNGLTADDVIKLAEEIKAEQEAKKREQAQQEIIELYNKKDSSQIQAQKLKEFQVIRSRFYKRKQGTYYVREEPIIELTVLNNTEHAVSRAYFTGTLASPNRSVPWLKEEFNYEISGGLEPGEETTWYLAPNIYSEWGEVNAPADAVLTVETIRIDDAYGQVLYSTQSFSEYDQERLQELLKDYPEFTR
jgi:hypothetical protein